VKRRTGRSFHARPVANAGRVCVKGKGGGEEIQEGYGKKKTRALFWGRRRVPEHKTEKLGTFLLQHHLMYKQFTTKGLEKGEKKRREKSGQKSRESNSRSVNPSRRPLVGLRGRKKKRTKPKEKNKPRTGGGTNRAGSTFKRALLRKTRRDNLDCPKKEILGR